MKMKNFLSLVGGIARSVSVLLLLLFLGGSGLAAHWPAWRGAEGSGRSLERELPVKWDAETNIRWKTALPERGNSTPIVWGNRVFITQALKNEGKRLLICFDRANGKELWRAGTTYTEPEATHNTNPFCSASPVTDGERVIVWFGSAGLFCFDFEGKEIWKRDLGPQQHEWGYGGSAVLGGDLCFLNFGPGERTFLLAVEKKTGKTVWQVEMPNRQPLERTDGFAGARDGVVGSWSTPLLVEAGGRQELIMTYPERVQAFNPKTGEILWSCDGLNPLIYTSPIFGEGIVVGMGGYSGAALAVRAGGTGDVTKTHRLWAAQRTKNRIGAGVIHEGHIYILNTPGLAECINLRTGKTVWEERVRGKGAKSESWSSMVLAGDNIYVLNQSGETIILKAGPKFELAGINPLDGELTNSSHAISDGEIFIRTHKHLWCIQRPEKRTALGTGR